MSTYGVTPAGFVVKPLLVIKQDLEAGLVGAFGADINLDPREPLGQVVGVFAERFSQLWDLAEAVYRARDPDGAVGDGLDAVAAITGTVRTRASRSSASCVLAGDVGRIIPVGSAASAPATGARFSLQVAVTLAAVPAWAGLNDYLLGDRCAQGGAIYQALSPGRTAASGGPTGTGLDILDGTVHWRWVGTGAAAAVGVFEATVAGPLQAPAGAVYQIETPVAGWSTVFNVADAVPGTALETDEDLRLRREESLRAVGGAATEAVRADVSNVEGVSACLVFENVGSVVDGDGLPPKSIEVLVTGGDDQAIREAIWGSKGGGIETHGSVSGTIVDSQGDTHTVEFSRPVAKLVFLDVSIKVDPGTFPADGDAQLQTQLAARVFAAGEDVVAWGLKRRITVSGIVDVPALELGLAAWPTSEATLVIGSREQALLDSARIRVTHV